MTYLWDVSPDGRHVAILKYSEGQIHILSLGGQPSQQIDVQGWKNLQSVGWASDGKNLFATSLTTGSSVLLQVGFKGTARVLWEQKGSTAPAGRPWDEPLGGPSAPWAVPSPDGRLFGNLYLHSQLQHVDDGKLLKPSGVSLRIADVSARTARSFCSARHRIAKRRAAFSLFSLFIEWESARTRVRIQ